MNLLVPGCLLLCVASCVPAAHILAIIPMPGKSHFIYCQAVLSALAARGHHVTVYSAFIPPQPVPNMVHIEVHTSYETVMKKMWTFETFKKFVSQDSYFGFGAQVFWKMSYIICEEILQHEKIKELLASKEKFDLVITEALFGEESFLVFGHFFNAPTINLNGFGTWSVINRIHGNALQIPYMPDSVSFAFTNELNYVERFRNFISTVGTLLLYKYDHLPKHNSIIQRAFNDPSIPPLQDMVNNISLTLANFHPSIGYPLSTSSNIVPVGGVHIAKELPPLPKDIKEFLDSAKNAAIYFSLGTVVPVHLMPQEYLQTFVKVFQRLPYKVLWKIEADSVPNLPSNVMISKWLPQQSVLAHPNCVLFITHGGLLSQHEVFQAGVPVVGIPIFGDQPFNVRLYEHLGVGVKLDFTTLTEDTMYQAVMSVVGKPKFIENAKRVSALFHHRPMSPADTAVFWVEYVLHHRDVRNLRPAAADITLCHILHLDILGSSLAAVVLLAVLMKKALACLLVCWRRTTAQETVSSNKKKN